jgi:hypothetical protein
MSCQQMVLDLLDRRVLLTTTPFHSSSSPCLLRCGPWYSGRL